MQSLRQQIFDYVNKKYGTDPEYPWARYPTYAVLRHDDNKKWYALVMNIDYKKIDFEKCGIVDVINVKLDDVLLRDMLIQKSGFYPGYHISRGSWISIVLDGTVDIKDIENLVDISFKLTASKKKLQKIRPPKDWLVPANPKYFDIVHAFDHTDEIEWKQGAGLKKGDTVYIYVGAPFSAIFYKCCVAKTDIPYNYSNENVKIRSLMKIKLQKKYDPKAFTFAKLKEDFNILAIRGPRSITHSLSEALK